jgi:hypothetical protein
MPPKRHARAEPESEDESDYSDEDDVQGDDGMYDDEDDEIGEDELAALGPAKLTRQPRAKRAPQRYEPEEIPEDDFSGSEDMSDSEEEEED